MALGRLVTYKMGDYNGTYIIHRVLQDGGVKGRELIFSCENSNITTYCWTTINRRMLDPAKKRYPTSKHKGEAPARQFSSVQSLSRVQVLGTPWTAVHQASRPSPTPRVYSKSCPLSWWCHPTISSSVIPFSSCPQSFPSSGSFQMSQLFTSGGQSIGVSVSTSVLPMSIQDWSPLGWTGWISLKSKGLSAVFSNTTVQKHQFFGAQLSL